MPRSQQIITAFTSGEVSPTIAGRVETEQYPYFCALLENMFVHKHGGVFGRGGMHFVLETKFPQGKSRCIPFIYDISDSYVLEFGDRYVRFFRDDGYVENVDAVKAFIGDGSSTKYLYAHPEVAEADIKVLKNGEELEITTDYTVAPADLVGNQIEDFTNALAWDLNYDAGDGAADEPWVLNLNTAAAPIGSEPILRQDDINIARGSLVDFTYNIDSYLRTINNIVAVENTEVLITQTDAELFNLTSSGTHTAFRVNLTIPFTVDEPDTITASLEYGNDLDGWQVIDTFNKIVPEDETDTWSIVDRVVEIDVDEETQFRVMIRAEIASVGNANNNTNPRIEAGSGATLDIDLIVNHEAMLNLQFVNAQDEATNIVVDPADPTYNLLDQEIVGNYPLRLKWFNDKGLEITLSDPLVVNKRDGWEITFVVAPAISDAVVVYDGSSTTLRAGSHGAPNGDIVHVPSLNALDVDIYEIEAPFLEDELDDIYYAQANDQLFVCHYAHKPWRLTRVNAYDWRWEQPEMVGAPWEDENYSPLYGYPRVVSFFQERLWFASTLNKPQTFWGSRTADFYEFDLPAEEDVYKPDDPVEYTLAAYTQETIEWMSSERVFLIGTAATEHRLDPDQYIAADRLPQVSRMTSYGGAHQLPIYLGNLTCFVHSSGKQLRSFKQDGQSMIEAYTSIDMGWMAEHLFYEYPFKEPTYALIPHNVAVMVRLDGIMLSASYDPSSASGSQHDVGWARQITQGWFKSCIAIPDLFQDQIWAIVEVEIDDLNNPIYDESEPPNIIGYEQIKNRNMCFMDDDEQLDSMLTYPPVDDPVLYPPLQEVCGLSYLEGKTVSIVADGALHPDRTVSQGCVTLDYPAQVLSIGLSYTKRVKMMPFEGGNPAGTAQSRPKRWVQIWANMYDSINPIINGKRPPTRNPSTPMNTREPNKTGAVRAINVGFDRTGQIEIEQDLPFKLHLLSLYGDYEVHSG